MTEELTIDDLASASRVPSRTIRFYQSKGALMPPTIRGRVAFYGPKHIERLKLIAQLQDRGLTIDAIRDLCASMDRGDLDLAEWLGVEGEMQRSWAEDEPRVVSEGELFELAGERRPGLLAELVKVGLVERAGEKFLLKSPTLLAIAARLEHAGVDLHTSAAAARLIQKHMERAAKELVSLFLDHAEEGRIDIREPQRTLAALRPTGALAVRVIFGREMDRAMRRLLESGRLARVPAKNRRARKS